MKTYDVVIVGAGIIGLSIAWQVARRSKLKVLVLDKGADVGEGSTGASSAVCRHRYSRDEVVYLARDGINAYRNWGQFTALTSVRARFNREGVLWLPGEDQTWADREHQRMRRLGIATEVLDADNLQQRFPALNACVRGPDAVGEEAHACERGGRYFLEVDGGYVDPVAAAQDLVTACRSRDVEIRFNERVSAIDSAGGKVKGVSVASGDAASAPLVINAAGPWCGDLYAQAGIEVPWRLAAVRIQVLYRDRPDVLAGHIPVTVDVAGGIYFRTQNRGAQLVVGSILEEDERELVADPDEFPLHTDADFEARKLHALHHRLPQLPYRGKVMGYCGLYTVNRDDVHPILGPTNLDGFWVANGFSGHGFKLAPAIGSILAKEIAGGSSEFDTEVPLSFLSVDRAPIDIAAKSVLA